MLGNGAAICPKCGFQMGPPPGLAAMPSPILGRSNKRMGPDGLVLCIDTDATESSNHFRKGIKGNVPILLDGIVAAGVKNVRVYVLEHRDEEIGERPILYPETSDLSEVKRIVQEMKYHGGGVPPETHLQAAKKALDEVGWSNKRSERNVYLGFWNADTKPLKGMTVDELANGFMSPAAGTHRPVDVILVAQPEPGVMEFANAVGAEFIHIAIDPSPAEMKKITARLIKSISCVSTKVPTRTGTRTI
jgi:hypothetical protein